MIDFPLTPAPGPAPPLPPLTPTALARIRKLLVTLFLETR